MFRVGVTTKEGKVVAENFNNKNEADEWVLEMEEKVGITKAIILNKETKEREIINF